MKNLIKKHFLLFILLVTISACKKSGERISYNRDIDNFQMEAMSDFEYEEGKVIRFFADDTLIYLSSTPDNTIKEYTYTGTFKRTLGKGGGAPWENGTIWSFARDSSFYWVHDAPKMAVKKYDYKTDTLILSRRCNTSHNVLYIGNNTFVVPRLDESGAFYMSFYDAENDKYVKDIDINKLTERFDKLAPYADFTFQGDFCKNNAGKGLFYCFYSSAYFIIDIAQMNVEYFTDLRKLPIPEPVIKNEWVDLQPQNIGFISGAIDDNYIYFLVPEQQDDDWRKLDSFLIDMYDIHTKQYLKSFKIPSNEEKTKPMKIVKTNKALIVFYEGGYFTLYKDTFLKLIN